MGLQRALASSLNVLILALAVALWAGGPFATFFAPSPTVVVEERVEEASKTLETSVKLAEIAPVAESNRALRRSHPCRGEPQPAKRPASPIRNALRAAPLVVRLRL